MTLAVNKNGFIFDPENGISYTVNDTGLFILNQMQKGLEQDAILQLLVDEYDVNIEHARSDMEHYMGMLKALRLVED